MMESLMLFQNGGGGEITSTSSSAAMSASDLFHHHNNNNNIGNGSAMKRRQSRNYSGENYGGFNDHSLVPYSSSNPYSYSSLHPSGASNGASVDEEDDLREQLIQKEKDLILAAELGKALLEKNEELNEANEKMADEFSKRLEVKILLLLLLLLYFCCCCGCCS